MLAVFAATIAALSALGSVAAGYPIGQDHKDAADKLASSAAKHLQSVVDGMRARLESNGDNTSFDPQRDPLLTYSDPARGYIAAGVWRLGNKGRPKALVAIEYWLRSTTNEPQLMFEFHSVAPEKFELTSAVDSTTWKADGTALGFRELQGTQPPADSERTRLIQMRNHARRFVVSEINSGDPSTLRLLPQPIDRYQSSDEEILDGALFVFAYGTNPELALFIECQRDKWRFAVARLSWAELIVELDRQEVARFPQLHGFPASGPYRSAGHSIQGVGAK
jgi:hypothetical protein